jgi:anaerobic magnesium-protoporphyrin IX monomethyl ester cyclase
LVKTRENLFPGTPIKVVLINPPPKKRIEKHDKPDYPHLGLAYIATFLRSKNVDCNIIDGKFELIDFDEVKARLQLLKPDIVGITAMTHEIHRASEMAQVVKGILPKAMVVVGGPHASALPVETLAEFTAFDLAVFGEGELTMLELVKFVSSGNQKNLLPKIKGVTYRDGHKIQKNEPREVVENLDDLPFPDWGLLPKSVHYPIVTGRGCPFRCIFCMRALGNRVRKRSAKNVVDELKFCIEKYEPKYIHFLDETISINKQYLLEVLDLMTEAGLDKKIKWDAQTRVDLVDYDLLRRMKVAGCVWLGFGIESGNSEILKDSGKNITLNQAKEAVNMARKAGINTDGYFILGHPFETQKTAMDTINFACRLGSTRVTFGIMVPYPGTEIYKMALRGDGGYKIISHDWQDFGKNIGNSLELETLSRRQLEKLQMLGYLKFYIRNLRIVAGLQYFIHQRKLGWTILKKFLGASFP